MRDRIEAKAAQIVADHPMNRQEDGAPYFQPPIFGLARGADPIWAELKTIIGPHHATPAEAFAAVHGELPKVCSVVSWALPAAEATLADQRGEDKVPCRRWSRTRDFGQQFINEMSRAMVEWLAGEGIRAVAPFIAPSFRMWRDERLGWASTWSERHAAYAGGLGTFSINDALITRKGISHRLGSVVVELDLPPEKRVADLRGYCLFAMKGTCGACIKRCPAGALSEAGHDRDKCYDYCYKALPPLVADGYGVKITGCGLCQSKVPCERGIPKGLGE